MSTVPVTAASSHLSSLPQDLLSATRGNKTFTNDDDPEAFVGVDDRNATRGDEWLQSEGDDRLMRALLRALTGSQGIEETEDLDVPLLSMGNDKPYPPMLGDRAPYAVAFDGPDDPLHPLNWPLSKKIGALVVLIMCALSLTLGSSLFSTALLVVSEKFHVGLVVATLGTSLFVLGFASGPVLWAPLSELYGRKIVLIILQFGYCCFTFATATAQDIQTLMICRFFSGFIGAAALVVVPAAMADMFSAATRGTAMICFAMVVFGGPLIGPIMGAFIVKDPNMGWRWTLYLCGIIGSAALVGAIFLYQELHHPLILVEKARTLRRRTGNWGIHAPHEEFSLLLKEIVERNLTRPVRMLFSEPILFLISLYNSFIYGLLYLFLTAYPLIFGRGGYGFIAGVSELPYLGMFIGMTIGGVFCLWLEERLKKKMDKGAKVAPEERLMPMKVGGISFTIGMFWLTWTGNYHESVHWIVPTIGGAPIGFGLLALFLPLMNYLIECYLLFAASAMAANTMMRSLFAAAFPLFSRQMFQNMGTNWAGLLLGLVAAVLAPVPFLFSIYGKKLRAKSKFAFVLD